MLRWFRFHNEALDDPRVQDLPGELFKFWVNLLCIASRNEGKLTALKFHLRQPEKKIQAQLSALHRLGLLDHEAGSYRPHNWDIRQYQSDSSTPRVKRFRERLKKRFSDVSEAAHETLGEALDETHQTQTHTQKQKKYRIPTSKDQGKVGCEALSRGEGLADPDPARAAAEREAFLALEDDDWPPPELDEPELDDLLPPAA